MRGVQSFSLGYVNPEEASSRVWLSRCETSSFYQAFKDAERRQRTEKWPMCTPSQVAAVAFATMAMVTMLLSFGQVDSIRLVFMMCITVWRTRAVWVVSSFQFMQPSKWLRALPANPMLTKRRFGRIIALGTFWVASKLQTESSGLTDACKNLRVQVAAVALLARCEWPASMRVGDMQLQVASIVVLACCPDIMRVPDL
jgi:hypothetical protein